MTYTLLLFSPLSAAAAHAALQRQGYTELDGTGSYLHHASDAFRFARATPASTTRVAVPAGVESVIEFADYHSAKSGQLRKPYTDALAEICVSAGVVAAQETTGNPVDIREFRQSVDTSRRSNETLQQV